MKRITLIAGILAVFFASCKPAGNETDSTQTAQTSTWNKADYVMSDSLILANYGEGMYAQFHITEGDILVRLEMDRTPLTVANFVALTEGSMPNSAKPLGEPYYDGLIFHRVISYTNGDNQDFMIQGGDPLGNGTGGPGYQFRDEFHPDLRHNAPGRLSMANSGPGSNGSQFFITISPQPHLDNVHSIFGLVVMGQDVVNRTLQGDKIRFIHIHRIGEAAKNFDAVATFNQLRDGNPNS